MNLAPKSRGMIGAIALAIVLVVARKPWALTTPQLWAEDGSVFLAQNDALGARAFLAPFQGYLHFLPRVIAWITSHVADVAAWPLLYNCGALLVTIAVFARFASPRLPLPGKPWLVLAIALVPHTGEVFLNITNLQWLTAFLLVQQALIAPPTTATERGGDLAIVVTAGLTGPFVVLLLPLFVWRWIRERSRDNSILLVVVSCCAAIQGGLILANPAPAEPPVPWHPLMLAAVLGSRLAVWPLLGSTVAASLPLAALALVGATILGVAAAGALRPGPHRELRGKILLAAIILVAAGVWRMRPDTWETANLANGDRYFFIPRVLLAWLLIWEFGAASPAIAWAARAAALLAVALELPQHRLPAPTDYHWAAHCDAIRRGEPAQIPTLPDGWTFEYAGRRERPPD